jgi:hypothetical protein
MNLHGIVSVSGKPGLWKAMAQNKTGFILESLDAKKLKLVVNISTAKLAALDEITIFGDNEDIKLTDVLQRIKLADNIPDVKADGAKLRPFFREVAPDHDEEKVYASDIKKVINWFNILKEFPLFDEEAEEANPPATIEETQPEAPVAEEASKAVEKKTVAAVPSKSKKKKAE